MKAKKMTILVALCIALSLCCILAAGCANADSQANDYVTVIFADENGKELQVSTLQKGDTPEFIGVMPENLPSDERFTYTWGWDKEIVAATEDATYTLVVKSVARYYTVKFLNADGSVLQEYNNLEYGVPLTAPQLPTVRESTARYTYGWEWETAIPDTVKENAVYKLKEVATTNKYLVKFFNEEGVELSDKSVVAEYGDTIVFPDVEKEGYYVEWETESGDVWTNDDIVKNDLSLKAVYYPYFGEVIDRCFLSGNGLKVSDSKASVPDGYDYVWEVETTSDELSGKYYSAYPLYPIAKYSEIRFAVKTTGTFVLTDEECTDESHEWLYFSLMINDDGTFNLKVKNSAGGELIAKNNLRGFIGENDHTYTDYSLNAILYGVAGQKCYATNKGQGGMTIYCTEIRGERRIVPVIGRVIDDKLLSANGIKGVTAADEVAPDGFENVWQYVIAGDGLHGMYYSAAVLTDYAEVHFAVKTNGTMCFKDYAKTDAHHTWLYFSLTQNADKTWNVVVTNADGKTIYSAFDLSGYKNAGVYTDYSLNAILYGVSGYFPYKPSDFAKDELKFYFTEIRGTRKIVPITGKVIDDKFLSANGIKGVIAAEETAPNGFENVWQYVIAGNDLHGMYYSAAVLTDYAEVCFAVKTNGTMCFKDYAKTDTSHAWLYFSLTQNADKTWNVVVTNANGDLVHSAANLSGYKNAGVYTDYSLNAILYGVSSYFPYKPSDFAEEELKLYFTEVRGTLKSANNV